jgi:hypothetical protein
MNKKEYIELVSRQIQKQDIEQFIEPLIQKVLDDGAFRQLVIDQLISHDHILVYYHSFLINYGASEREPSLFYGSWDKFVSLLDHENSYHRNYAMQIIANLTKVDIQNRFELIIDKYYKQLSDVKFLTRRYCLLNSREIIVSKPLLCDTIINKLIGSIRTSDNSEKQQNLIISDFVDLIPDIAVFIKEKDVVTEFLIMIKKQTKSSKVHKQISGVMALNDSRQSVKF